MFIERSDRHLPRNAHRRRRRWVGAALVLGLGLLVVGTAAANPGTPQASIALPYQADLVNASGDPLNGSYDVVVRIYDDTSAQSALLWEESFPAETVSEGRLSLVVGTGTALSGTLDADLFAAHPLASIALEIDGESLGDPTLVGMVPRALAAESVPANGIRFGGSDGLIPVEAVEPTVRTFSGTYASGAIVQTVSGWDCTHAVSLVNPTPSLATSTTDLADLNSWVAHVGPGIAYGAEGIPVTFDPSAIGDDELQIKRLSKCDPGNSGGLCLWGTSADTSSRAYVHTICVAP